MNIIFELKDVRVNFFDKEVLNIERLAVHQFDRIGIVGRNGAGKSTLLKLINGDIKPTSGNITSYVTPAYFEQIAEPEFKEVNGAYLSKLGIPNVGWESSGGEQTRMKLAEVFSEYHEAILLDEPTTHLDQSGKEFLIDELQYYYGGLLLISHDRALLDQLVTTIWEVENGMVKVYKGNYTEYANAKQNELEQQKQEYEQYIKEKDRLEKAVHQKMLKAENIIRSDKKSKQKAKEKPSRLGKTKSKGTSQKSIYRAAKAMEHRIEKLREVEPVQDSIPIIFRQSKTLELNNKHPILADGLVLKTSKKVLLENARFQFPLGKKIAITGQNGSGKSTLLNHIAKRGDGLEISPKVKFGHFKQMSYRFQTVETLLTYVKSRTNKNEGFLRTVLHQMQFSGTDLQKRVIDLSGGEAIRLKLCLLFLGEYNILLLDEPTNFLDIHALEALEQFILGYEGTIIIVSHDKAFIDNIADVHYELDSSDKKLKLI